MLLSIKKYNLFEEVSIAPLATFRIVFGLITFISGIRFWANGWIEQLYIEPSFHFKYYGFEFVKELSPSGMYLLFSTMILSALLVCVGLFYRLSIITFFLSFTYIELIDKATYLNHYYFVSLIAFIMIFLPAAKNYSLDARLFKNAVTKIPRYTIDIIRFQLCCVYFFAGVAKLNQDWLFEAMPMAIWLKAKSGIPVIGPALKYEATAYLMSWCGAIYDLFIPFFLIRQKTVKWAYVFVIIFHALTAIIFPRIGIFPYMMMGGSLIFFSASFHKKLLAKFYCASENVWNARNKIVKPALYCFVAFQLLLPFRHLAYPGNLFWTEQGFRFSWRVMLMEKMGNSQFYVVSDDNETLVIENSTYLSPLQEKQMSTQPDMVLEFAHFLYNEFKDSLIVENNKTIALNNPAVKAKVYTRLHNHGQLMVDTNVNLAAQKRGFHHKDWIIPFVK